jgi:hypothetical protein
MSSKSLGILIWTTAVVVLAVAITATRRTVEPVPDVAVVNVAYAEPEYLLSDGRSGRILSGAIADPFFRDGPQDQLADSEPVDEPAESTLLEPIAQLRVTGILGGPPWHAVLSGGPLMSRAVVVTSGDSIASMVVLDVGPDGVRILDTTGERVLMLEGRR